jgi:hypothetical protein
MKKLLFLLIAGASTTLVHGQDVAPADVPSVVANALKVKYPDAAKIEWELKEDTYKADFEIGSTDHDVWITKTGNIIKHKEDIKKSQLPPAVTANIQKDFANYKIDDADKVETEGKVLYQVELDGTSEDRKLLFNQDGTLVENKVD